MKKFILLIASVLFLSACNEEGYYSDHYYEDHHGADATIPLIRDYELVDNYLKSSEFEAQHLYLSPFGPEEAFEVNWRIDSYSGYNAHLYINDFNSLHRAIHLSSSQCGPGWDCDWDSYQYCLVDADYRIGCDQAEFGPWQGWRNIEPLISQSPQPAWLLLEVCDVYDAFCDVRSLPVHLE